MSKAEAWDLVTADDPSDWKNDFEFLKGLDSSLRCDLCYDIFTAPVSIKDCGHSFCSACIRNAINKPGEEMGSRCPRCMNKNVYDSSLLPQPSLENAAQQWRKARQALYKMQETQQQQQLTNLASTSAQPQTNLGKRVHGEVESSPSSPSSPQRRRSKRNVSSRERSIPNYVEIVDDSSDEDEIINANGSSAIPEQDNLGQNGNHPKTVEKDYREINASDLVQCPLCQHTFTFRALNIHLDKGTCNPLDPEPSPQERGLTTATKSNGIHLSSANNWLKTSSSGSSNEIDTIGTPAKPPKEDRRKKLVRPAYDMLKIADVKKLLKDWQLNSLGNDRKKMVERHRKWINLFNANLDASEPMRKSNSTLRTELEQWERAQERAASNGGLSEKRAKTWAIEHRDDFANLARQARESHARDRSKHKEEQEQEATAQESEEGENTNMEQEANLPDPPVNVQTASP